MTTSRASQAPSVVRTWKPAGPLLTDSTSTPPWTGAPKERW
jgi:hypothetical protein